MDFLLFKSIWEVVDLLKVEVGEGQRGSFWAAERTMQLVHSQRTTADFNSMPNLKVEYLLFLKVLS